jgi:hypothetical protein
MDILRDFPASTPSDGDSYRADSASAAARPASIGATEARSTGTPSADARPWTAPAAVLRSAHVAARRSRAWARTRLPARRMAGMP